MLIYYAYKIDINTLYIIHYKYMYIFPILYKYKIH